MSMRLASAPSCSTTKCRRITAVARGLASGHNKSCVRPLIEAAAGRLGPRASACSTPADMSVPEPRELKRSRPPGAPRMIVLDTTVIVYA